MGALKTLATSGISGHVVVLTYQCKNYLKFSDPRIVESGRVVIVDGASDTTPGICLVNPSISAAFAGCYSGLQKIGAIVENCPQNTAYISTMALKDSFPESIYHISQLNNGYDILVRNDPRTKSVPRNKQKDVRQRHNKFLLYGLPCRLFGLHSGRTIGKNWRI